MKRNCARKSARGGRALLTGLMRCGRCGRMMRVFYGMGKGHAHRYQCRGDDGHVGPACVSGPAAFEVDRAIVLQLLEAVSDRAIEAAIFASDQIERSTNDIIAAAERDLEAARYEANLAARRHELVDPAKRFVARELEARWNGALEKVLEIERRIEELRATAAARPKIDRTALMLLARDLPAAWNAPTADTRTKQRLMSAFTTSRISTVRLSPPRLAANSTARPASILRRSDRLDSAEILNHVKSFVIQGRLCDLGCHGCGRRRIAGDMTAIVYGQTLRVCPKSLCGIA